MRNLITRSSISSCVPASSSVPLSWKAQQAIGVMGLLILLLVTGVFPPAISAMVCAGLMILSGVINLPAAYRGIDWNTCILIGAMIPIAILAGLFIVTGALTQLMANTAVAMVFPPLYWGF
jgi:di/tricarboxylate transporter